MELGECGENQSRVPILFLSSVLFALVLLGDWWARIIQTSASPRPSQSLHSTGMTCSSDSATLMSFPGREAPQKSYWKTAAESFMWEDKISGPNARKQGYKFYHTQSLPGSSQTMGMRSAGSSRSGSVKGWAQLPKGLLVLLCGLLWVSFPECGWDL